MHRTWRTLLGLALTMATIGGSARADAIRPKAGAGIVEPAVAPPEVARSGPGLAGALAPTATMLGADWREADPGSLFRGGLAGPSLRDGDPPAGDLARPAFPPGPLLGAASERMAPAAAGRSAGLATTRGGEPNVRIPEPASLALLVAGIIGLAARYRLRRGLVARKPEVASIG